jgi:invasion protein IalB
MRGGTVAALILCLALSSRISAEETKQLQRFEDWEVACAAGPRLPASQATGDCKAVQRLTVQGGDETVFLFTIVRGSHGPPVAIVSMPLGGYIAPGLELSVDGKKPYKLLVETCNAAGCHAGFPLSGRIDKELRVGKLASFRLWTAKDKPTDLSVSLKGFSDALTHLERQS